LCCGVYVCPARRPQAAVRQRIVISCPRSFDVGNFVPFVSFVREDKQTA
jgi:hypothetical protein